MLILRGRHVECFSLDWDAAAFALRGVAVGDPAFQTYFEMLVLILAVEKWCFQHVPHGGAGRQRGRTPRGLGHEGP